MSKPLDLAKIKRNQHRTVTTVLLVAGFVAAVYVIGV